MADAYSRLSVLVVDDDDLVRATVRRMFTAIGVGTTHVAASASDALETVASLRDDLDVIVSDLEMPDIDGLEFLRRLSEGQPRASVLILSGKAPDILRSVELMAREYGLQVIGVLPKPTTLAALRDALDRHLRAGTKAGVSPPGAIRQEDLVRGLERREFALFYQPMVELSTRRVCGAEALVRWRHPTLGLLSPALFIGMAEELGLMHQMTLDLLEQAAGTLADWLASGLDVSMSVNMSLSCLAATGFSTHVLEVCARHGVSPRRLIVEVTETVAMTDVAHCLETLARLRMHGVGLAIDDFGTGHSSFQQLSRVPFTELKVDRGFVTGAGRQPLLRTIVESNVRMARALNLVCTGEGIESQEDWDLLLALGCDIGQGYFIAGAMEGAQFPGWIRSWQAAHAGVT